MNTLGISAYFHDSSAALCVDGKMVAVAREETFSRIKHDSSFPSHAIEYCLSSAGIKASDLDWVGFYEEPEVKFSRVLSSYIRRFPKNTVSFAQNTRTWLLRKLWAKQQIAWRYDTKPSQVVTIPHHLAHAATAFSCTNESKAALLTIDAVGEWNSTSIYLGTRSPGYNFELLDNWDYPNSLGLFYSAFTAFLGFQPLDAECSTMALAAFGNNKYAEEVEKVLRLEEGGDYRLDLSYFDFLAGEEAIFTEQFLKLFGEPRRPSDRLPLDALEDNQPVLSEAEQRWADVAASVQVVFGKAVIGLAKRATAKAGTKVLCFGGGGALNAVANSLIASTGISDLYIPPDPGDGGTAVGAALLVDSAKRGEASSLIPSAFLGPSSETGMVQEILPHCRPQIWNGYVKPGISLHANEELRWMAAPSEKHLIAEAVNALMSELTVGWIFGRSEYGPRSLGGRCILSHPKSTEAARRIRTAVKERAPFRPFALSMTKEVASRVLECPPQTLNATAYMHVALSVKPPFRKALRAGVHVDGTTRAHIVCDKEPSLFKRLLEAFAERSGHAALVNTSFNDPGYPIVKSATEALLIFARSELDILIMDNIIIYRN